ncbi:MAG: hypothetical protein UV25_C0046G0005 [candidate division WWE3 bacterium GW2011_GWB1_42_41]|nr:MAG: hypothetical protein UV25_C0046G0005 [candidate division WWE3 bacterium GW2011_GWB1_42_41]
MVVVPVEATVNAPARLTESEYEEVAVGLMVKLPLADAAPKNVYVVPAVNVGLRVREAYVRASISVPEVPWNWTSSGTVNVPPSTYNGLDVPVPEPVRVSNSCAPVYDPTT